MINVKREITLKLRRLFPQAIIYTEQKSSGFKEPAFFVAKINTNSAAGIKDRQQRSYGFQIVYFPDQAKLNADIDNVEARLLDDFTKLDKFAHVTDREFVVQDKCLVCNFNVRIYTRVIRDEIIMQKLKQEQKGMLDDGRRK